MNPLPTFHDLGGLQLVCPDSVPTVFGILDPSIAPPLLYYSSIPIIVVALLFGLFVVQVSRASLASRLFLWIAIMYSMILTSELFLWTATPAALVHFVWEIDSIFLGIIAFLLVYFTYVFTRGRNMPTKWLWILLLPLIPVFVLAPTSVNLSAFDLANCEGIQGWLRSYIYGIQLLALITSAYLCIQGSRKTQDTRERMKMRILATGIVLFFGIYILSNVFGDITLLYEINLFGPLGMAAFLATIVYLIVRYHAFNVRLFGAQALVGALVVSLFAALFVRTIDMARYVLGGTVFLVSVLGIFLIRGVKKEIEQREHIEQLARELEKTNERQETLIHFVGHEVKGFLTKDAGAFAAISQGDFGTPPDGMKPFVERALIESRRGADSVANILKASNLKKGTVTYTKEPFDLKELVAAAVEKAKAAAEQKRLTLTFTAAEGSYAFVGDKAQINDHVLRNLIDNAISYTPTGSVVLSLKSEGDKYVLSVQDTGVGINEEDTKILFTEGGHGKDSQKINVHSTGYGLFIAKSIVEAHGGTIRAESEGEGKGSTFIVELPLLGAATQTPGNNLS